MNAYANTRNLPGQDGTSAVVAPGSTFGELGPRQIWAAVSEGGQGLRGNFLRGRGAVFLSRSRVARVCPSSLVPFSRTPQSVRYGRISKSFRGGRIPGSAIASLAAGPDRYPIVDAGMWQLWHTGWMHNRVRMVVASFLVKHLRQLDARRGVVLGHPGGRGSREQHAGMAVDGPDVGRMRPGYFRVFAPVLQGERFDGDGDHVRRWVPELASLPLEHLHAPLGGSGVCAVPRAGPTWGELSEAIGGSRDRPE